MADKPNLVIVMTDQQRADFASMEGFPLETTPTLDALASRGVRFSRAYTPTPVCLPARCSMFTGRFPAAHGLRANYLDTSEMRCRTDMLQVLKQQGYATALVGKNHSHIDPQRDLDYAEVYSHMTGPIRTENREADEKFNQWMEDLLHWVSEEPTPFPVDLQFPVRIVDSAIEVLKGRLAEPFFLWISFPEPHNPFQVPEPYFDMFPPDAVPDRCCGPEVLEQKGFPWDWERKLIEHYHPGYDRLWRRVRSNYCGMIRLIDDQLGRLVEHLESSRLSERTHLLFVADHGDFVGDYGLIRKGVGLAECLIRIPYVWSGPGVSCGAEPDALVSHVDVFPTVCDILDVQIPEGVQGRSLVPILTGRDYPVREFESIYAEYGFGGLQWTEAGEDGFTWDQTFIKGSDERERKQNANRIPITFDELNSITQSGHVKMVRKGDWKLVHTFMGRRELYNLKNDPAELNNLINDESLRDETYSTLEEMRRRPSSHRQDLIIDTVYRYGVDSEVWK